MASIEKICTDADDVADFINDGFELDIISGRQISDQVAKGNIGKVPKKIGQKTILPEADIKDFASLAFTKNSACLSFLFAPSPIFFFISSSLLASS